MKQKLKAIWSILTKEHFVCSTWNDTDKELCAKNINSEIFVSEQTDWYIPLISARAMVGIFEENHIKNIIK